MVDLQSALTGESMPVTKKPGDEVFSGSTCKQGEIEAVVIATGVHTFFGKAAHLVDSTNNVGHFQKVITFCLVPYLFDIRSCPQVAESVTREWSVSSLEDFLDVLVRDSSNDINYLNFSY